MQDVVVRSWAELQDALFYDAWDPRLGRFRGQYAFRGLSDAAYPLSTTLMRLGGAYERLERHLLRNFRKYAHRDVIERDSPWHWLAVAQHYGLPTRLLDWTHSPYVALHFATANIDKFDRDAVIWAVNYQRVHQLLPTPLREALQHEGASIFTLEMLTEALPGLNDLGTLAEKRPCALFLEPPSMDDRIVNQFALFSVMSDPTQLMDTWLTANDELGWRLTIPAALKWEIRDKLDQANITERVLFPGLDGLSQWLRRHYSPKT